MGSLAGVDHEWPVENRDLVDWSAAYAQRLLSRLPDRWKHTAGVAQLAGEVATEFGMVAGPLVAAAYLHDIGYSPAAADTGFHPLDGARHLHALGLPDTVVRLVAHHTTADAEACERWLGDALAEYPPAPEDLAEVLLYSDMHVGPAGEQFTMEERIAEIHSRYAEASPARRALDRYREHIEAVDRRIEALRLAGPQQM